MHHRPNLPLLRRRGKEGLDHHHSRRLGAGVLFDGGAGEFTGGVGSRVGRECVCESVSYFFFFFNLKSSRTRSSGSMGLEGT